jgi:hypothetical protein
MAVKGVPEMKDETLPTFTFPRELIMISDAGSLYQNYFSHHASAVSVLGA